MKKKLAFSIHESRGSHLIIKIDEVTEENRILKWSSNFRKLYQSGLFSLCSENERRLLQILIDAEVKYARKSALRESIETMDFSKIHIEAKECVAILKEIAATTKLYFRREEILPNFFGGADLIYRIDGKEGGGAFVQALVKTPSRSFSLSDCALIGRGSPNWLIKGNALMMFKDEISWKWLGDLFEKKHLNLSQMECLELIEVLQEEQEMGAPKFVIDKPLLTPDPHPIIVLADQTGAFANLVMDYGEGQKVFFESPLEKWRNRDVENNFKKDLLEGGFQEKKIGNSQFYCPLDKVKETLSFFLELGWGMLDSKGQAVKKDLSSLQKSFFSIKSPEVDFSLSELKEKLSGLDSFSKVFPGKHFKGVLRNYQDEGLNWLSFLYKKGLHGILADDMGLGKTVQVIAFISTLEENSPILIVAPTSLIFHWNLEFQKFLPSYTVRLHQGNLRGNDPEILKNTQVILTSYAILRQDLSLFQKLSFSAVFLDEAQAIKNAETQNAKAVCLLNARFRLSITGTPIENHFGELLSQFKFLMPDLFRSLDKEYKKANPETFRRIKRQLRPFILRRRKSDVDEQLPEKIEQTIWLEMDPEQRNIYDAFYIKTKEGLLKILKTGTLTHHRMEIFEAILRLRQICCHPQLISEILEGYACTKSAKSEALFSDLEILLEEGQKVLVFSQFTSMLKIIAQKCVERGWIFSYLDGSTKDRESAVLQFQEEKKVQLFLISLKAGGLGLNLTAADYVILYEPWWNEAVENQAIDRAHRIGRHHPVVAKRYVFKNTIEERMMLLKESKRVLTNSLFENSSNFELEDLEFLLT